MGGATAFFSATALADGWLVVEVTTTGTNPDTDGYLAQLDTGAITTIPNNGTSGFSSVPPGDRTLELTGIASNCTVGDNPQTVTVLAGETAFATFTVVCA
jgi:hypothetical protein